MGTCAISIMNIHNGCFVGSVTTLALNREVIPRQEITNNKATRMNWSVIVSYCSFLLSHHTVIISVPCHFFHIEILASVLSCA